MNTNSIVEVTILIRIKEELKMMGTPQVQEEIKAKTRFIVYPKKIAVAFDGSENSYKALEIASTLSKTFDASLVILHSCEEESCDPDVINSAISYIGEEHSFSINAKILKYRKGESSISSEILRELALGGYDLIVLGARGTSRNDELYLGSVAASIVLNTNISFMVVR